MTDILKLKQCTIEDKYSTSNIMVLLKREMHNLESKVTKGVELLHNMVREMYWDSKQTRMYYLASKVNSKELVEFVFMTVMTTDKQQSYQGVVTKVAHKIGMDDFMDSVRTASEVIAVLCETDVYDIYSSQNSETGTLMIKSRVLPSQEVIDKINGMHYVPPMICKPRKVTNTFQNGYLTINGGLILKEYNKTLTNVNFDAINAANSIAFSLDNGILSYYELLDNDLDPEAYRNAEKRSMQTNEVIQLLCEDNNKFYFTHKYDSRGRMYSQGYHINYQSDEYRKSLLNLNTEEIITGV